MSHCGCSRCSASSNSVLALMPTETTRQPGPRKSDRVADRLAAVSQCRVLALTVVEPAAEDPQSRFGFSLVECTRERPSPHKVATEGQSESSARNPRHRPADPVAK